MRIGITEMPEKGYQLTPLANGDVEIKLFSVPIEDYDSDGNKHITANVLTMRRKNFAGLAQSIEENYEWYWQQGEQEEAQRLAKARKADFNTTLDKMRADMDYICMMAGVDMDDESEGEHYEQEV